MGNPRSKWPKMTEGSMRLLHLGFKQGIEYIDTVETLKKRGRIAYAGTDIKKIINSADHQWQTRLDIYKAWLNKYCLRDRWGWIVYKNFCTYFVPSRDWFDHHGRLKKILTSAVDTDSDKECGFGINVGTVFWFASPHWYRNSGNPCKIVLHDHAKGTYGKRHIYDLNEKIWGSIWRLRIAYEDIGRIVIPRHRACNDKLRTQKVTVIRPMTIEEFVGDALQVFRRIYPEAAKDWKNRQRKKK